MSSAVDPEARASAMRSIEAAFLIDARGVRLPEATEVWLVRHGDAYDGVPEGVTLDNPPLSAQGREQAERFASRARRLRFDAVYASTLERALETARALTGDIQVDERLVEVRTVVEDGRVIPIEQIDQVVERMRAAVADAVAAHPGGRVLMFGHALAILGYLCDVLKLDFGALRLLPFYTSVSIVRVLGERRMVGSLADVAHLEDA